ncbi:MAG: prepilin-type N-terminal cleavage/methylation domain-containing protein [Candidatus Omnitrophica bacterium]|nr:prepilin-type N-terminal cleavage/methylation domain-containing protein [Candidatus Omnitrophota bacterium]
MKKGFTLLELIVVIIVLGVIMSIALPQYFKVVERSRTSEAVNVLGILRAAQVRYYAQNSAFTNDINDLDVDVTTPTYYDIALNNPAYAEDAVVATLTRNNVRVPAGYAGYTLTITVNGLIACSNNADACRELGYSGG